MTDIQYGLWHWQNSPPEVAAAKDYAAHIDPTPKDKILTEADQNKLPNKEKIHLHQLATLAQEKLKELLKTDVVPLFDLCLLFSKKPKPRYQVTLDKEVSDRLSEEKRNLALRLLDRSIRIVEAIAVENPEFQEMVEESCWPTVLVDRISINLVGNLKKSTTELKKDFEKGGISFPYEAKEDHDAITIAGMTVQKEGEDAVALFILIDAYKTTSFAGTYVALVHELMGHAYQYLTAHPDRFGIPDKAKLADVKREIVAFQRSIRFLEKSIEWLRNRKLADMATEIEKTLLPKEKKYLADYEALLKKLMEH